MQFCQSDWPKSTILKSQFDCFHIQLYRKKTPLVNITWKPHLSTCIRALCVTCQKMSKHVHLYAKCRLRPLVPITKGKHQNWWLRCARLLILNSCILENEGRNMFLSVAKRPLLRGLKWHSGGLIILLPHTASGCDMAIISGLRINSVTKERSLAPARPERGDSGDYVRGSGARRKRLLPAFLQWNSKV